jgi:nucleoside 2-deoxyribosyltransferase
VRLHLENNGFAISEGKAVNPAMLIEMLFRKTIDGYGLNVVGLVVDDLARPIAETLILGNDRSVVIRQGPHIFFSQSDLAAPRLIFDSCKSALDACGCVVALLDGAQIDDGTAWEIGYAYSRGIPVYGIRTDCRIAGETRFNRMNSMIEGCLRGLVKSAQEAIVLLQRDKAGSKIVV